MNRGTVLPMLEKAEALGGTAANGLAISQLSDHELRPLVVVQGKRFKQPRETLLAELRKRPAQLVGPVIQVRVQRALRSPVFSRSGCTWRCCIRGGRTRPIMRPWYAPRVSPRCRYR